MTKKESHKVLIIKTGYTEFLDDQDDSLKVSFGDIMRITPLLHVYKEDHVTWMVDKDAFPLLEQNPYIDRLVPIDFMNSIPLLDEDFDTLINLEKRPEICLFADKINAWRKYGFRLDKKTNKAHAYDRAFEVLTVSTEPSIKTKNKRPSHELLFEMVGEKWNGEDYVLGYKPKTREKYEVGLNTIIGPKWPVKAWPEKNWDKLEDILKKEGFSVTRQDKQNKEVLTNLYSYMDWVNSCGLFVTNDSFGAHLALALKKKIIALMGPTPYTEYHFYNRGPVILPEPSPDCMPCFGRECKKGRTCMEDISVERVYHEIKNLTK